MAKPTSCLQAYSSASQIFAGDPDELVLSVSYELANGATVEVTRQDVANAREYGLIPA